MKAVYVLLAALLFVPLMIANFHCTQGAEPETVIVPVGEPDPSGEDPYDTGGDLGCGDETADDDDDDNDDDSSPAAKARLVSADEADEPLVLLTFNGQSRSFSILIGQDEFFHARAKLLHTWMPRRIMHLTAAEVDEAVEDLCAPWDKKSEDGKTLSAMVKEVFGKNADEIYQNICD